METQLRLREVPEKPYTDRQDVIKILAEYMGIEIQQMEDQCDRIYSQLG